LKFVTPNEMHTGEAVSILAERKALYERAKSQRGIDGFLIKPVTRHQL